jgi:hypothetical protein
MLRTLIFALSLLSVTAHANTIMNMKARSELIDAILVERFETVLPNIMNRTGIDMWVIMSREYNEDCPRHGFRLGVTPCLLSTTQATANH